MTRERVAEIALSWLRTPYHHRGRIKGVGTDCAMFLAEVYEEAGLLPHIEPPFYPMDWALHQRAPLYLEWIEKYARPVETPGKGDIALFRYGHVGSHAAIILDTPRIIHAKIRHGVVYGSLEDADMKKRFLRYYSIFKEGE